MSELLSSLGKSYMIYVSYLLNTESNLKSGIRQYLSNEINSLIYNAKISTTDKEIRETKESTTGKSGTNEINIDKLINMAFPFVKYTIVQGKQSASGKYTFGKSEKDALYFSQYRSIYNNENFENERLIKKENFENEFSGTNLVFGADKKNPNTIKRTGSVNAIYTKEDKQLTISVPSNIKNKGKAEFLSDTNLSALIDFLKILMEAKQSSNADKFYASMDKVVISGAVSETIVSIMVDAGIKSQISQKKYYLSKALKNKIASEFGEDKKKLMKYIGAEIRYDRFNQKNGTLLTRELLTILKTKGVFYTDTSHISITGFPVRAYDPTYVHRDKETQAIKGNNIIQNSEIYYMENVRKTATTKADIMIPFIQIITENKQIVEISEIGALKISIKEPISLSLEGALNFSKMIDLFEHRNKSHLKGVLTALLKGSLSIIHNLNKSVVEQNKILAKKSFNAPTTGHISGEDLVALNGKFMNISILPKTAKDAGINASLDLVPLLLAHVFPKASQVNKLEELNSTNLSDIDAFFGIISIITSFYSGKPMSYQYLDLDLLETIGTANCILVVDKDFNNDFSLRNIINNVIFITDKGLLSKANAKKMDYMKKNKKLLDRYNKTSVYYHTTLLPTDAAKDFSADNLKRRMTYVPLFLLVGNKFVINTSGLSLAKIMEKVRKSSINFTNLSIGGRGEEFASFQALFDLNAVLTRVIDEGLKLKNF